MLTKKQHDLLFALSKDFTNKWAYKVRTNISYGVPREQELHAAKLADEANDALVSAINKVTSKPGTRKTAYLCFTHLVISSNDHCTKCGSGDDVQKIIVESNA